MYFLEIWHFSSSPTQRIFLRISFCSYLCLKGIYISHIFKIKKNSSFKVLPKKLWKHNKTNRCFLQSFAFKKYCVWKKSIIIECELNGLYVVLEGRDCRWCIMEGGINRYPMLSTLKIQTILCEYQKIKNNLSWFLLE